LGFHEYISRYFTHFVCVKCRFANVIRLLSLTRFYIVKQDFARSIATKQSLKNNRNPQKELSWTLRKARGDCFSASWRIAKSFFNLWIPVKTAFFETKYHNRL